MARCRATRTDGNPCQARSLSDNDCCFWHAEETREAMLEASRKGGSRRVVELPEVQTLTAEQARKILAAVIESVAKGALDAATGRTIGYLLSIEAKIREGHELERRIETLEVAQSEAAAQKQRTKEMKV